jgi:hypothetical protein
MMAAAIRLDISAMLTYIVCCIAISHLRNKLKENAMWPYTDEESEWLDPPLAP